MTTISFVVPVYNAAGTLRRCLDSILRQDWPDKEIIAINDGSTDGSLALLREYEAAHDCVRVIDKANEGVAPTRNLGIREATGDYLMFVDDDDVIDADYATTYMSHLGPHDDIVMGGWRRVDGSGRVILERAPAPSEWATYINIYPWDKVFRRAFLVDNDLGFLDYGIGEDLFFTFSAKAKHPRVRVITYVGYTWTDTTTSVSNTSHKGLNADLDVLYLLGRVDALYPVRPALLAYYYERFLVWYLLYSGRGATRRAFLAEHDRLMAWLDRHRGSPRLTPLSPRLRGEKLFERASVLAFRVLRLHLMGVFARVYCRGGAEGRTAR